MAIIYFLKYYMVELSYELIVVFIFILVFIYFKIKYRWIIKYNKCLLEFVKRESHHSLKLEIENSKLKNWFENQLRAIWKCINRKLNQNKN